MGGLGEKGEGSEKYRLVVTNSHGNVKFSTRYTVDNILIPMCGARGVLEISGAEGDT